MKASWFIILSCLGAYSQEIKVSVNNDLGFDRKEIISVPASKLSRILKSGYDHIHIRQEGKPVDLLYQWVDLDSDGKPDELLFQAEVSAKASSEYVLIYDKSYLSDAKSDIQAFSRFVPERTDDYAWENDRVAFRTYGPDAQRRFEQKMENGTLSSGIDIWLKRTDRPVIDKWYAGYQSDPNFYHKDRGEGYDPYHVGASRGTGGTGIWHNDSLHVSKNFVSWKTVAKGPLRTIFELTYAPYSKFKTVETKRISLDLGSNFPKFEIDVKSDSDFSDYAVGIALHKNEGQAKIDRKKGIFRYFEQIDDAFVGEGVIVDPKFVTDAFANTSSMNPDHNNLLVLMNPARKIVYYAGFAWTKSGQISNLSDWDALLERQSEIIANPLRVSIN